MGSRIACPSREEFDNVMTWLESRIRGTWRGPSFRGVPGEAWRVGMALRRTRFWIMSLLVLVSLVDVTPAAARTRHWRHRRATYLPLYEEASFTPGSWDWP